MVKPVDSGRWLEVNLTPPSARDCESVLISVVDPLVHEKLASSIDLWFYFWEWHVQANGKEDRRKEDLRLRVRSSECGTKRLRKIASAFLDEAVGRHDIAEWYAGCHGNRSKRYKGNERGFYGPEVMELIFQNWMSSSELALAIIKHDRSGKLNKPRTFHLSRHNHLYTNQLRLNDTYTSLLQAQRYLMMRKKKDDQVRAIISAIDIFLAGD